MPIPRARRPLTHRLHPLPATRRPAYPSAASGRRRSARLGATARVGLLLILLLHAPLPLSAQDAAGEPIRFATFNAALSGETADDLRQRLADGSDADLQKVARIVQQVRPDVLLLQEFDHDASGELGRQFRRHYLEVAQGSGRPIHYAHAYAPPVNTGLPTDLDLDGDGRSDGPGDAHGWGAYPGQYGMLLLSRYPVLTREVIDRRDTVWGRLPFSLYPEAYYPAAARPALRLSSKTHALVPLARGDERFAVLISHPTPPVFDGEEDRNGRRNFDEIGLLAQMVHRHDGPLVVMGDLNADPADGESRRGAVDQLLQHTRLTDPAPTSAGAVAAAERDGGVNADHRSDPARDTADWADHDGRGPGNLRVDYVLPSTEWTVADAGVYWPTPDQPDAALIEVSDHRLVWVDLFRQGPPPRNPRRAPYGR